MESENNFEIPPQLEEKSNKNKSYLLIIIILIVIISLLVGGMMFLNNPDDSAVKDVTSENFLENSDTLINNLPNNNINNMNDNKLFLENEKDKIISNILEMKKVIKDFSINKNVDEFRKKLGDLIPGNLTDEEIIDQSELLKLVFGDVTEELLNSDNTTFDLQNDTVIVDVLIEYNEEFDFRNTQFIYLKKENGEWIPTNEEGVKILRAKPLNNTSQQINIQPLLKGVFDYYQIVLQAAEGIEARVLMNDVEIFTVKNKYVNSTKNIFTKNIIGESLIKPSKLNYIDIAIDSISSDVGNIVSSDNNIEIIIYALNELRFAEEKDELIRINISDLEVGTTRYNFELGQ
ncbi:hypothetical protein GW764_03120 [Candidatus Parcubacteria bacterium]|nr:hypothetical protein [Candidatus Parcubacteria bacterium]